MKIHNEIQQGSAEWHSLRAGRIGGSESAALLSVGKGGGLSVAAKYLAYRKAAEIVLGYSQPHFTTPAMERGTELEPYAREAFENIHFVEVAQVGYISEGRYFGVSPDGLFRTNEKLFGLEIKCPEGPEFMRVKAERTPKKEHIAQCQWLMNLHPEIVSVWYFVFHPDASEPVQIEIERDNEVQGVFDQQKKLYTDFIRSLL